MKKAFLFFVTLLSLSFANAHAALIQMSMDECVDTIVINVGDTITWTNYDDKPHQVVSVDETDSANGLIDSDTIEPGKSFSFKFDREEVHEYYCVIPHNEHGFIEIVRKSDVSDVESINVDEIRVSKIPRWFVKVLTWYDQNQVSEDELINASKFLAAEKIIILK